MQPSVQGADAMGIIRAAVHINGIVQGVGFRPFLHRCAERYSLAGWARNTVDGVELALEGEEDALRACLAALPAAAPRAALIESMDWDILPAEGLSGFHIAASDPGGVRSTLISPDIAICPDCKRELFTPSDRRFRYPFINCTNCGPRFTIIRALPYDRPATTMAPFQMCPKCAAEYADIRDRRYHAQPNCCPACGPQLRFYDADGQALPGDALKSAVSCLTHGGILAVKGLGGIHLACRIDDPALIDTLRARKKRDEKPFAVMCASVEAARRLCGVSAEESAMLESPAHPIVLLTKKDPDAYPALSRTRELGVMLPYTPLHCLLLSDGPDALVMTSANLSDLPILSDNAEALRALKGIADGFLLHDRAIETRCDDSLLRVLEGRPYFIRRSRGYAPAPLVLKEAQPSLLACGAEQKASFCLTRARHAFLSQHIGDLKNFETLSFYERQIAHFEALFDLRPETLVCDLHPDYLSTRYAEERSARDSLPLLRVQHHHAHMASCMAENGLSGDLIGLIWDGTGFGPDGSTWGGELLCGGYTRFERRGSLLPIPLPGGDRAVKEPWRIGTALLLSARLDPAERYGAEAERVRTLLSLGLNCPQSSGMGRLFDGAASILGLCDHASYEGQGAVLLEAAAIDSPRALPLAWIDDGGLRRFDWRPMIRALYSDKTAGVPTGELAAAFMNTLIVMAGELCVSARKATGLDRVVLSGGSFQNLYLMQRLPEHLKKLGFGVWHHSRVSANDSGLSLGQSAIAAHGGEIYVPCSTSETDEDRRQ